VELFDEQGEVHGLPGQVRVAYEDTCIRMRSRKPKFLEVLERVTLNRSILTA
jgi:hypothetical protein